MLKYNFGFFDIWILFFVMFRKMGRSNKVGGGLVLVI